MPSFTFKDAPKNPWDDGVFTYMNFVVFYGFHVGKYTVRPMDASWVMFNHHHLGVNILKELFPNIMAF